MKTFFLRHKGICGLYLVFMMLNATIAVVMAELLSEITAFALHGGDDFPILIGKIVAFCLYITFIYVTYDFIKMKYRSSIMIDLEQDAYRSIMKQEMYPFHRKNPSEYSSFFLNDLKIVEENYLKQVPDLLSGAIQMIVNAIYVFQLNGWILVMFVVSSLIMLWIPKLASPAIQKKTEQFSQAANRFTTFLKETFSGFDTIATNHARNAYIQHTKRSFHTYQTSKQKMELAVDLSNTASNVFSLTFQLVLIIGTGFLIVKGELSADYLFSIVSISGTFLGNVFTVTQAMTSIQSSKPMRKKWQQIRALPSFQSEDAPVVDTLWLDDVTYEIQNRRIINRMDFCFERGKHYLIIGESGSGKSTLFHLLSGKLKPQKGRIVTGNSDEYDSSCVTTISQTPVSFEDTVQHNMTLYRTGLDEEVASILPQVHLDEEMLEKIVGEDHATISGGELQRISIARSLIDPRSFLLCDESTANLDPQTCGIIEDTLANLKETGVLFITHHVTDHTIESFDVILKLEQGRLHDVTQQYKED